MKRMIVGLLVSLAACGGHSARPAPVENQAPERTIKDVEQTGTAEARVIQRTGSGGVLELGGDREQAMRAANDDMRRHCGPDAFTIVQEGEEAVGNHDGGIATVWRVHYQCNN